MKQSGGILLYRKTTHGKIVTVQVLLVHPGGPYYKNKDDGSWSIPKGELDENENPEEAARRELLEETGINYQGTLHDLGWFKQSSAKTIRIFAGDGLNIQVGNVLDVETNRFSLIWPPGSGKLVEYPEIDRAEWWDIAAAETKILKGQKQVLDALSGHLRHD